MSYDFEVSDALPSTARVIYDAWMSSDDHSDDRCARADQCSPGRSVRSMGWLHHRPDARARAWTANCPVVAHLRVLGVRRALANAVILASAGDATMITIRHANVRDGHRSYEDCGWQENYFDPMRTYFEEI
jgi:hypothetical protein